MAVIGFLMGTVAFKQAPTLWLDVNGVGYELEAPMSTFYELPATGERVRLFTHLAVREDAHLLYGFATEPERDLFRALIRVNGVGAKLALGVLSGMSVEEFLHCVRSHDVAMLVRLPGVGKKTAERLLIEMQGRVDMQKGSTSVTPIGRVAGRNVMAGLPVTPKTDALTALVALGYREAEASRAIERVYSDDAAAEDLIRQALKSMVNQ